MGNKQLDKNDDNPNVLLINILLASFFAIAKITLVGSLRSLSGDRVLSRKGSHTSFSRQRTRVGEIGARRAPDNLGVSHAWIMGNLANAPHLAPRGFA